MADTNLRYKIGYCTNVHAGTDLDSVMANLDEFAVPIQKSRGAHRSLGIGLWLSNEAAVETYQRIDELREFLKSRSLIPFTFNAFPFFNFHQAVVKHNVYLPSWDSEARLSYTKLICKIADELLPEGEFVSISTLPIGWRQKPGEKIELDSAANLKRLAIFLDELESNSGRRIVVCLEPEPGCILSTGLDVVKFFKDFLLSNSDRDGVERVRRYLGVCHDVCHAAVMFEEQSEVLKCYADEAIFVGKVQVSSAIGKRVTPGGVSATRQQLSKFAEPRYLHQTTVRENAKVSFFEDLPLAMASFNDRQTFEFRSHFHVPIYLKEVGGLSTTRMAILECLNELDSKNFSGHFEIETYAWDVSPQELRNQSLQASISAELEWFQQQLSNRNRI